MIKKYNPKVEPQNWQDGVEFSYTDPCIFIVYPAGASGDLLASIVNSHYLSTGSDYFGITENGQVMFRPSDYKLTNLRNQTRIGLEDIFTEQLLFDIAESLGKRNLNYSMIDQMIFSNHMHKAADIELILDKLPNSKIIRIFSENSIQDQMIEYQQNLKNANIDNRIEFGTLITHNALNITSTRLLNIPYISLFSKHSFHQIYKMIVKFLDLDSRLIRFDFIKYYLKQQTEEFSTALQKYKDYL
tara:strand:+ start:100 stop:831 length:732 start_codon:yes stop_codon:yes gene_type:complete